MDYFYEGKYMVYKFKGKLHKKIILYHINYKKHIKCRHMEVSLNKIESILKEPDYIYKPSINSKTYYYERRFGRNTYRVVVDKCKRNTKEIITAYKVTEKQEFNKKHAHCVYDYKDIKEYERNKRQFEEDKSYFYQLFGIAE